MATIKTLLGYVKGPKGDRGETGGTGAPGAAATVEAGTVNTVAYGQPAHVTNVGTPQAAVFNFDIPEGRPGNIGEISGYPVNAITTQAGDFPIPNVGDTIASIVGKQAKATADARDGIQSARDAAAAASASISNVLGDFADMEATATASKAYEVGDYLVLNEQFYKVTAAIAQGNALTVGGNIEPTNVGTEVSALNKDLANTSFRDYSLGNQFTTEQAQMIAAGDFKNLVNGGYWEVNGKKVRIADNTNWYKRRGDTEFTKPHLVIMCDENVLKSNGSTTKYMKDSSDTTGAYGSTKYRATYRAQCKKFFTDFFGTTHIASYRGLIATAMANGRASSWTWNDCDVELPTENMIFGSNYWGNGGGNGYNGGSFYGQLQLFKLAPEFIVAKTAAGERENYWEQDVVSATAFADVSSVGYANGGSASNASVGLRPFALLI